jgi:hypothetical protein
MDNGHALDATRVAIDKPQPALTAKRPKDDDRRIARLRDLLEDALDEPDPLRANLRAAIADLLEIGYRLGAGIKATMGSEPKSLARHEELVPVISSMALVHRQATRYVQLDQERAEGEKSD